MHRYANPARFLSIAKVILPVAAAVAALAIPVGLIWGLVLAPADYQQGDTVRIMYLHVPAAWMSMFVYACMAGASATALVWKHPVAEVAAKAAAPLGAAFTLLCLITGSLWGQPMWGTWWVWDARLTSVLILLFLYLGYIALVGAFDDPQRGAKAAGILAIVGAINLPIIKFSVDWWNTLHQPASVMRLDGPTIHPDMLWPLLLTALGFKALFVALLLVRIETELLLRRVHLARVYLAQGQHSEGGNEGHPNTGHPMGGGA